jgi:hypothetical protein
VEMNGTLTDSGLSVSPTSSAGGGDIKASNNTNNKKVMEHFSALH